MEPKWFRGSLFHQAGALRTRWVCHECGGVKCEILLTIDAEPESCLRELVENYHAPEEDFDVV